MPKGYEAQINSTHRDPIKTGSLFPTFNRRFTEEQKARIIVPEEGIIAWQLHGGYPGMEIAFRNIHFKDLSKGK